MSMTPESLILRILQRVRDEWRRPVTRTELVKLVYLVDYTYAQHAKGETLSGLDYFWDNHGPNAMGNAIVKHADWMELTQGTIRSYEEVTPSGNSKFLYEAQPDSPVQPIDEGLAEAIIDEIVQRYGGVGWREITRLSKETRPLRNAKKGDRLDLRPDAAIVEFLSSMQERVATRGNEDRGAGVSLRELRERYGIRA